MPSHRAPWHIFARSRTLLIMLAVFCVVSFAYVRTLQRGEVFDNRIQTLQDDIEELQRQREELLQLKELTASPEFVEREARARLGLKKPGEHVIIVPSNVVAPYVREEQDAYGLPDGYQDMAYPQRWFYYFFSDAERR